MPTPFFPGQRWICDTELQLGLGVVTEVEGRTVSVLYPAVDESRTYAQAQAPLSRIIYQPGDAVLLDDGAAVTVKRSEDLGGFVSYTMAGADGEVITVPETRLGHKVQLNRPGQRLLNGQTDRNSWYSLRIMTRQLAAELAANELHGLIGCRTSILPHQLYIAWEVGRRYSPRVLLADEVGLGKTIEAGLILHQQLLCGRASRVLIVVPESLLHQWLVEMLRRFNLIFSVFDEERLLSLREAGEGNPFETEQLVIVSLATLTDSAEALSDCLAADWDLLIVDEAHHLAWSPDEVSHEYRLVEQLARQVPGVLLLTATPEQLGKQGHFARLHLLDHDRFADYDSFVTEEGQYSDVAQLIEVLLGDDEPGPEQLEMLADAGINTDTLERREAAEQLLDRQGTGRILFRNSRVAIQGFPERRVHLYPLSAPDNYPTEPKTRLVTQRNLSPEIGFRDGDWLDRDPRVDWLAAQLQEIAPHKVLVITASRDSALALSEFLKQKLAIPATAFHEGMSLVQRDRAAARFADPEQGSPVLICSEIGSEGRNFQFAHHLVLFDLPLNPDLLEQRIGRLDRIGQTHRIEIHVPFMLDTAQAVMAHWYHQGLNAFAHTCPPGHQLSVELQESLHNVLLHPSQDYDELLATTRARVTSLTQQLADGRDHLLEYNSCRPDKAAALVEAALAQEADSRLAEFLEAAFDCIGIQLEEHRAGTWIARPGEAMVAGIQHLPEDGLTFTYHRHIALAQEDIHFMSWEHPLLQSCMDYVLTTEMGNSNVTAVSYRGARPGTMLMECQFILEAANRRQLAVERYLPAATIRVVLDEQGRNHSEALGLAHIESAQARVDMDTAKQIVTAKQAGVKALLSACEKLADQQAAPLVASARQRASDTLGAEVERLRELQRHNPTIRDSEIDFIEQQLAELNRLFDSATLQLDSVRVIVATD